MINDKGLRMKDEVAKAAEILKLGGIVIFPTDTAFGIGCRIDKRESIKRLFRIRKRNKQKAVPVLVDSIEMAKKYLKVLDKETEGIMEKFWPGALTIVYKCKKNKVYSLVRGEGETLGVRVPDNDLILGLIKKTEVPILAPSANFPGEKTPFRFKDLNRELVKLADYVLPGETNNIGSASTVIDCSINPWKILRQGTIKIKIK